MSKLLGYLKCDLIICSCKDNLWAPSDELRLYFHCPACGEILWENGTWLDMNRKTPRYLCGNCARVVEKRFWPGLSEA